MDKAPEPLPKLFFETVNAYERTAGIKLDFFSAVGETSSAAAEIAQRCQASPDRERRRVEAAVSDALLVGAVH